MTYVFINCLYFLYVMFVLITKIVSSKFLLNFQKDFDLILMEFLPGIILRYFFSGCTFKYCTISSLSVKISYFKLINFPKRFISFIVFTTCNFVFLIPDFDIQLITHLNFAYCYVKHTIQRSTIQINWRIMCHKIKIFFHFEFFIQILI